MRVIKNEYGAAIVIRDNGVWSHFASQYAVAFHDINAVLVRGNPHPDCLAIMHARNRHPTAIGHRGGKTKAKRSGAARMRCVKALLLYRRALVSGVYLVLTYGRAGVSREDFYQHRDRFLKRLRRAYPEVRGVWTLEAQKRLFPHLNFVLWGCDSLHETEFRDWAARAWLDITGCGGSPREARLQYGAVSVKVASAGGLVQYVTKDLLKNSQADFGAAGAYGNWWGRINGKALKLDEIDYPEEVELSARDLINLCEYVDRSEDGYLPSFYSGVLNVSS